jgi:hypothetical protein
LVGAVVYTALAASIALDRAAVSRPELAQMVPGPFRQQVLTHAAARQLYAGHFAQALLTTGRLLSRDPLSPGAAGILGTARLALGDAGGARGTFRTSAKLGWRDAATQVYWFEAALGTQDFDLAGMRFEAIARQWPDAASVDELSARLENDPRGLAILARRMALGATWAKAYATPRAYQPPDQLAGRARVLISAGAIGGAVGCDAIAPLVNTLVDHQPALAGKLWASQCRRAAAPGRLADGGFEAQPVAGRATDFDWQFPGNGSVDVAIVKDEKAGHRLKLRNSGALMVSVAMQRLVLAPGRYRVSSNSQSTPTR